MDGLGKAIAGLSVVALLAGCAGQFRPGGQTVARENRDLRAMLKQAMRQVRQLELEQERLRSSVDTIEYRQRLIAESAGVDAASMVASRQPAREVARGRRHAGVESTQYGSAMPRVGLEALGEEDSRQPSRPDLQTAGARRPTRGRVIGPLRSGSPESQVSGAKPALRRPERGLSHEARVLPSPSYLSRSAGGGPALRARETSSSVRAEDELEMPEVPSSLRSSVYATASEEIRRGAYEDAVQNLRNFIHDDPGSAYADDAQYWIGESYLRQGAYSKAIIEFNQVVVHYRAGDQGAKALLKQAEIFSLLGDEVDARFSLQKVVNNYPGSPEAVRAAAGLLENSGERASAAR